MAEHLLNCAQVRAAVEHVRRAGVAQGVRVQIGAARAERAVLVNEILYRAHASKCCPRDTYPSSGIRHRWPHCLRTSPEPGRPVSEWTDRVLIAGGGIAGLATAAALGRHGIASMVLNRRDQALDAGLGINLPGNAVMALGAVGLGDGLERLGAPLGRHRQRTRETSGRGNADGR